MAITDSVAFKGELSSKAKRKTAMTLLGRLTMSIIFGAGSVLACLYAAGLPILPGKAGSVAHPIKNWFEVIIPTPHGWTLGGDEAAAARRALSFPDHLNGKALLHMSTQYDRWAGRL